MSEPQLGKMPIDPAAAVQTLTGVEGVLKSFKGYELPIAVQERLDLAQRAILSAVRHLKS